MNTQDWNLEQRRCKGTQPYLGVGGPTHLYRCLPCGLCLWPQVFEYPPTSTHFPRICSLRGSGRVSSALALALPVTLKLFDGKRFWWVTVFRLGCSLRNWFILASFLFVKIWDTPRWINHFAKSFSSLHPHPIFLCKSELFCITQATKWFTKWKRGTI